MANKSLPASKGYFNKEMQAILKMGEAKKTSTKKSGAKKK